ncbi:hypothetical protein A8L34_25975 [Bacillus sp. FJAT-27264]|uniref:MFS transporter n=1 Tax=Paenibacillus sp. (strain DSM 101736 / FJAT-27264) TaxID=1850362 RepID=UPI000807ED3A|nr:MFS transporter [Bacillus sp. FJAT-27264]OBZ07657.1 hypothetical protein A8L34_25975 [Bacillus sp. FJAT-27264]
MNTNLLIREPNYTRLIALLFWSGLIVLSSLYVSVPLIPTITQSFHLSSEKAAVLGSSFSLFYAIGCLIHGPISDWLGRKAAISIGLTVLSLATLSVGFVSSFNLLIFLRCVQGIAAAAFSPVALTYIGEVFPSSKRGTAIGVVSTGFLMAGIVGQLWGSFFTDLLGWHQVFVVLGFAYLLTLGLIITLLPSEKMDRPSWNARTYAKQWKQVWSNPNLLLCYGITALILFCFVGMYTVLGTVLEKAPFGLSSMQLFGVRALGIIGMLICPFAGNLFGKWGTLPTLRIGLTLAIVGLASMGLVQQLTSYMLMSVVFVAGISLVVPAIISLIGEIGSRNRAIATSMYTFVLFAGAGVSPLATARLLKTGIASLPFLTFAVMMGLGLITAIFIKLPGTNDTL